MFSREYCEIFKNSFLKEHLRGLLRDNLDQSSPFNHIQNGLFRGCSQMEGAKKARLPKICCIYPTMMKLGTVIPQIVLLTSVLFTGNQ